MNRRSAVLAAATGLLCRLGLAQQPIVITPKGPPVFGPPTLTTVEKAWKRADQLRHDLQKMKLYDNLKENWSEVSSAIAEGCTQFTVGVSRIEVSPTGVTEKVWLRVLPVFTILENGYIVIWTDRGRGYLR